ncbi:unnamed protein product [Cladocopium goreaui]|uniref:AB hydrolase-1 domain-containing protein n=1 Tax=Cladocopium goreaui TaxID=2562237 RepID=A0A9P1GJJ6_9DINO|nr:unnamed protein product [Cladocopium goreaui]
MAWPLGAGGCSLAVDLLSARPGPLTPPAARARMPPARVIMKSADGCDLAVRPHDGRSVGRFGYRRLTMVERSASVAVALLLVWLLSVPRGPWHRAAVLVKNRVHWFSLILGLVWLLGSAWLSASMLKILAVMLFARPKLLPPSDMLPSAFSTIRELSEKVTVHLLRKAPLEGKETKEFLPVLCFHGFGANGSSYEDLLEPLTEEMPDALVLCPDQVGFGLSRRPSLHISSQLQRNDLAKHLLRPKGESGMALLDDLTTLQMYTLSGNAVIARAVLDAEPATVKEQVVIGHSMGAITAAALAVSSARSGHKVKLVLESPAFLSKPCDRLEPSKIGRVTALALRWQRTVLRLVLQLPGLTYSRRFWQRGLAMAAPMDEERARLQVLRYRWPSLSEHWALGLANFVTARLITMEDGLVLHELIEASLEGNLRVLIITGDQDRVVPLARSKDLQSLLRCDLQMMEAIIHSFPNGGHVYYFGGKMVIG